MQCQQLLRMTTQVPGKAQLSRDTGIPPKAALVRNSDTYRNSQGHLALSVRRKKKCRFLRQAALGHKDTAMQMGEA